MLISVLAWSLLTVANHVSRSCMWISNASTRKLLFVLMDQPAQSTLRADRSRGLLQRPYSTHPKAAGPQCVITQLLRGAAR